MAANAHARSNYQQERFCPLVTVIVPVYEVADLLSRCVDSILGQTYANLDVILVDDGSPDACPEICDSYAAYDTRVRVIHQENGGLSAARNAGLDYACGEYVTFVDSDDWLDDDFVSEMILVTWSHPHAIVCGDYLRMPAPTDILPRERNLRLFSPSEVLRLMNSEMRLMTAWGKLYPTNLFKKVRFPPRRVHEDEFVVYRLYEQAVVIVIDSAMYYYWSRPDGIMGSQSSGPMAFSDNLDALAERAKFLADRGYTQPLGGLQRRRARKIIAAIRATRSPGLAQEHRRFRMQARRLIRETSGGKGLGKTGAVLLIYSISPTVSNALMAIMDSLRKRRRRCAGHGER